MLRFSLFLLCTLAAWTSVVQVGSGGANGPTPPKDLYGDALPAGAVARMGTIRFRHNAVIVFAAFLPGGKSVLSVGNDGVACAWEFPAGKEIIRFNARGEPGPSGSAATVNSATLSPDGKHLTVFCNDGFMRIWDWAGAKELGKVVIVGRVPAGMGDPYYDRYDDYSSAVGPVIYSPDRKTLMLTGSSKMLQFVDLPSGKEVGPNLGHTAGMTSVSFTPDGKQVVTKDAKSTHTWDAASGKDTGTSSVKVTMPHKFINGSPTIISPDGRVGVTAARFKTPAEAQAANAREAVLFDIASGQILAEISLEVDVAPMHRKPMLFSPDGKMLAIAAGIEKQQAELYEVASGKRLRTLEAGPGAPAAQAAKKAKGGALATAASTSQKMLFSPDGRLLAFQSAPGSALLILDTETGKQRVSIAPPAKGVRAFSVFSPDGRCLAVDIGDGMVTLIELATGQPRRVYASKSPQASLDADAKLSALERAALELGLDLNDIAFKGGSTSTIQANPVRSVAISPDGKLLAQARNDRVVRVWDILTGQELRAFTGHTGPVNAVAFSPNGKTLASASTDTTALLWDVSNLKGTNASGSPGQQALEKLWKTLAETDGAQAASATSVFAAAPKEAVAFIRDRLKPAAPLDMKRVEVLIAQLDSEAFKVRDHASHELLKLGDLLVPVLEKALAADPPPEMRQRMEELHAQLTATVLHGERLQIFRAVEVLELIGTSEARQLLQALARGSPGALATTSAQDALKR